MPRTSTQGARDHILQVASRLFYEHGVQAVGLQQIIDEYGCGKALLYREFASKDDLVVAWLQQNRDAWRAKYDEIARSHAGDPVGQLLAIVRSATDDVSCDGFRGCAFRNTHVEFPNPAHPAHKVAVDHLDERREVLRRLAAEAKAGDPERLADRIMLIIDGVIANGAVFGCDGAAAAAESLAEDVIRAAIPADQPAGLARETGHG
jgi:AcrR family transcriptional regulator